MLKLEVLPNEILIVCLEYLSLFELFHTFDRLNHRFSQLIRRLPLQLNCEDIRKQTFDRFCAILSCHPEVKQQIYSLHLSNKNTCGQIERFLSSFPLDEFSSLRLLVLTHLQSRSIPKLIPTLPSLSHLNSFRLSYVSDDRQIVNVLPMSNLQNLSILSFHSIQSRANDTLKITTLTIMGCTLDDLFYQLFDYFPLLKHLRIRFVSPYSYPLPTEAIPKKSMGMHLTHLHIGMFKYAFEHFAALAMQTPNLRNLSITAKDTVSMINALLWEDLIRASLIHLKIFQFTFYCDRRYVDRLSGFQSEFWWKEHHWYTEYAVEQYRAFVYTVPYLTDTATLSCHTRRFPGKILNVFDRVHRVILDHQTIAEPCQYYFPNTHSLELLAIEPVEGMALRPMDTGELKSMVNLSGLKHLNVSHYGKMLTSTLLIELFKQSPSLSVITMNPDDWIALSDDEELGQYFTERIKQVDILKYGHPSFENAGAMDKFCRIFTNVEQLVCYLSKTTDVFVLLNQLRKLTTMNADLCATTDPASLYTLLEDESRTFDYLFSVEGIEMSAPRIFLWIGGAMD